MQNASSRFRSYRRALPALGAFVLFAGMLFWTKLRLVSDIPRSAYAVPKEKQPAPDAPLGVDAESANEDAPVQPVDPEADDTSDDGVPPDHD